MEHDPQPFEEPANIRFLRRLVTVLTAVMIAGLLVIIALFVIRFSAPAPNLPDQITLPSGAKATAFTQGSDWFAVVTDENTILIYGRSSGKLRQSIEIRAED